MSQPAADMRPTKIRVSMHSGALALAITLQLQRHHNVPPGFLRIRRYHVGRLLRQQIVETGLQGKRDLG